MKKKPISKTNRLQDYEGILSGVVELLDAARRTSARAVNSVMTATYWEVGRRIVEFEQGGGQAAQATCRVAAKRPRRNPRQPPRLGGGDRAASFAVRELVAKALIHQDFTASGMSVVVETQSKPRCDHDNVPFWA